MASENREDRIIMRVGSSELELLQQMADHSGLPLSSYVRMAAVLYSRAILERAADRTQADRVIEASKAPA